MRILMVSAYAPSRDGIAAYALQAVQRLRADGHEVEVLSPGPSAAHHHLDLVGSRGALALARRVRKYDRVIVQFHPDVFYPHPSSWQQRFMTSATLALAWRAAKVVELRVHEVDYRWGRRRSPDGFAVRRMFKAADRICVHTDAEAADFHDAFGVDPRRLEVTVHGADFVRRVEDDRAHARRARGIADHEFMFLAIGFIQPHKGFDRAVRAFAGLDGCRLDVVGSVRVDEPEYLRHLDELERLAAQTEGAHLHVGYVTDDAFDEWLVAADVVVLPYRSIWSSSVLARAALYDRPVIVTRVGGLAAQAAGRDGVMIVENDRELAAAMRAAVGRPAVPELPPGWAGAGPVDRATVMADIKARAGASRSAGLGAAGPDETTHATDASAPLRRIPPLSRPAPVSDRPGAGVLKRLVRRVIGWEVGPVVQYANSLREATIEALEAQATRPNGDGGVPGPGPPPG